MVLKLTYPAFLRIIKLPGSVGLDFIDRLIVPHDDLFAHRENLDLKK
jgi:hypothetical protein